MVCVCVFGHYVRIKNESVYEKGFWRRKRCCHSAVWNFFSFCDWCKKGEIDGGGVLTSFMKSAAPVGEQMEKMESKHAG